MKSVLVWNTFTLLERSGGPSTYLFHLKKYFDDRGIKEIHFLNNSTENPDQRITGNMKASFVPPFFRNLIRVNQLLKADLKTYDSPHVLARTIDIHAFDIIHFHTTIELYQARALLKEYKGKVFLTSHTPIAPHLEHLGEVLPHSFILPGIKKAYRDMDIFAFKRADVIVFPVKEAMEPYYQTFGNFSEVIKNKKIEFIPTGVPQSKVKLSREEVRKKMNIPAQAKVICYAGRHNHVKGYDILKQLGAALLDDRKDLYFLILGKEYPLKRFEHEHWIEVGWTADPHSYINASDVFLLPNRNTYFDLILLEVLSLGKRALISETGGNKHFKYLEHKGLAFFDPNDLNSLIAAFNKLTFDEQDKPAIISAYQQRYSLEAFGGNYIRLYSDN